MDKYGRALVSDQTHQVVVMLCAKDEEILDELHLEEFECLLGGEILLEAQAASVVPAVYCVVGNGLLLKGAVFFLLKIDENGRADQGFNLPLLYLAEQAGIAADLGDGGIKIASRGQCAVPWHSLNLWEPGSEEMIKQVQQRIFRNRLGLKPIAVRGLEFATSPADTLELIEDPVVTPIRAGAHANAQYAERLEEVFGADGQLSMQDLIRLHSEQLAQNHQRYRSELESQQSAYLEQIKGAREEIRELKVALRQEQSRNRRLQGLLRGDP